jgi:hypothetical protein
MNKKKKFEKEKSKFIDDLVQIIKSDEYKSHIEINLKLKKHIYNFRKLTYWNIQFFDLVNKEELNIFYPS